MHNEFVIPEQNWFGSRSITEIPQVMKRIDGRKALIITDENLVLCGISKKIEDVLDGSNIMWSRYDKVQSNPTKANVYGALQLLKRHDCDVIIGVGGGSPNDCAKAVSILAANGGKIEDYEGFNQSEKMGIPVLAVNTTAGTASEISRAYLITDPENHRKIICKDIHALPRATINDQDLMTGLPARVTAETGMDALTHALESFVCNNSTELTRELAVGALHLIFTGLEEVLKAPESLTLRERMSYAQSLAGMAFCNSGVGLAHAIAHALGSLYGLPHGLCTAVVLPEVIRFNMGEAESRYAELGRRLFPEKCFGYETEEECAELLLNEVIRLSQRTGTYRTLSEIGVSESELPQIAEYALNDGNITRNPLVPNKSQLLDILHEML